MSTLVDSVTVMTDPCMFCGQVSHVEITAQQDAARARGELVQTVFADWAPAKRETLISGTHPRCWEELFGDPED